MTRWAPAGLILLVTLVEVASCPAWIYSSGFVDHWTYQGYFLNLRYLLTTTPDTYYASRMAWILPGFIAHSLFSPLIANSLLRLYLLWIATLSCFFLVRRSYGLRVALISTLLLSAYPDLLSAVGWNYVDGAVVSYSLLAMEELGAAASLFNRGEPRAFFRAGLAGAAFAAAFHSNILVTAILPCMVLCLCARTGIVGLVLTPAAALGVTFLTVLLGLISFGLGGSYAFYILSFLFVRYNRVPDPIFFVPSENWIGTTWCLVVPLAVCLACAAFLCVTLARRHQDRERTERACDCGVVLAVFFTFLALQGKGVIVLQVPFISSYFAIFLPIATGALIGRRLDKWKESRFVLLACCCVLLALVVGAELPRWFHPLVEAPARFQPQLPAIAWAVMLAAVLIAALWARPRWVASTLAITGIGATLLVLSSKRLDGSSAARAGSSYLWIFRHYSSVPVSAETSRNQYRDTVRAIQQLIERSHHQRTWMWYSYFDDRDAHYTDIASAFLWGDGFLNWYLPYTTRLPLDLILAGHYVAIMDRRAQVREEAIHQLERAGVSVAREVLLNTAGSSGQYPILLVRVTDVKQPQRFDSTHAREVFIQTGELVPYNAAGPTNAITRVMHGETWPRFQGLPPGIARVSSPQDYFATQLLQLKNIDGECTASTRLKLTVTDEEPQIDFGSVKMMVQDQNSAGFYQGGLLATGTNQVIVNAPAGTAAVRLVFLPNDRGFIRLPTRVKVACLGPN